MKKSILALACLAMSLAPAMATNGTPESNPDKVKTEKVCKRGEKQCKKDKAEKCDAAGKEKCGKQAKCKGAKSLGQRPMQETVIFESLNLTPEQQAQVKALNDARNVSRREMMQNLQKIREAGDSSMTEAKNAQKEISRKYLKDLQTVLTADQYVRFLQENYVNSQNGGRQGLRHGGKAKVQKEMKGQKEMKDKAKNN